MDASDVSSVGFAGHLAVPSGALAAQQAAERRQLLQAVKTVNESGQLGRNQLVFMVDSQTHRPIIRVEDRECLDDATAVRWADSLRQHPDDVYRTEVWCRDRLVGRQGRALR